MNDTLSRKQKIRPSIKKIKITRISISSNNANIDNKIRKYTSSSKKRNPFLDDLKTRTIDDDTQEISFTFQRDINHANSFNVNKILKKYSNISPNKVEDENSTNITDEGVRKNNLKKVTFSTVEVIRVENYKKYNKIKINPLKEFQDLKDNKQCSIF